MNVERIRHGGVWLCIAVAAWLLYAFAHDLAAAPVFAAVAVGTTLAGLFYVATGLRD